MTNTLDERIGQLVAEVADAAPVALQPPIYPRRNGFRGRALAVISVAIIAVAGIAMFSNQQKADSIITNDPASENAPAPEQPVPSPPAIFQRDRVDTDILPERLAQIVSGGDARPWTASPLDLDDSRRGAFDAQSTMWLVPTLDDSMVCMYVDMSEMQGVSSSCKPLAPSGQQSLGPTFEMSVAGPEFVAAFGFVTSTNIIGVVGADLVDGTFIFREDRDPVADDRDPVPAPKYIFDDGSTATRDEIVASGIETCRVYAEQFLLGATRVDLDVVSSLSEVASGTHSPTWISAAQGLADAAAASESNEASWSGWANAAGTVGTQCRALFGGLSFGGLPDFRLGIIAGHVAPPTKVDLEALGIMRRSSVLPTADFTGPAITLSRDEAGCVVVAVASGTWDQTPDDGLLSVDCEPRRTDIELLRRFGSDPAGSVDYLTVVTVPEETAYVVFGVGAAAEVQVPVDGLVVRVDNQQTEGFVAFDSEGRAIS